jgi:hypothetical protein
VSLPVETESEVPKSGAIRPEFAALGKDIKLF